MRQYVRGLVICLLLGLMLLSTGSAAAPQDAKRSYVPGYFGLELDGVFVGWVSGVEGGNAVSEVVVEQPGPDHIQRKHIAAVKYEDITLSFGTGMSKPFYDWIASTLSSQPTRKNGAIIAADYDLREVSRLEFTNALISEIGFPALDAGSKDAAKMTLKFAPEYTRRFKGRGSKLAAPVSGKQKTWLPANFRLRIDGLEGPTSRVNKIEALVVKQKILEDSIGDGRDYEKEPASLEIPNLVFTTAEAYADDLYAWHEDFVINGNNGQDKEKSGTLEYLSPDLKQVLFKLEFKNLGIFKLTPEKAEAGSEQIRRVKAELYVEEMKFSYDGAAK